MTSAPDPIRLHSRRHHFGVKRPVFKSWLPTSQRVTLGKSPNFFELQFLYLPNGLKICLLESFSSSCPSFILSLWGTTNKPALYQLSIAV